jgi:phosphatidylethanolamine-binding protein (PEBP) family uncharacterized protein
MRANLGLLTPAFAALSLAVAATGANAADIFSLTSTTFEDGKLMPKKVANSKANQPNNPNCVGDNVSPQFSWSNPPDGTKSFVLMMFDPEGRAPSGVSHWVAYGIPASVTGFAEAETSNGRRLLFRTVHAAEHDAASLYVHPHRHGPRAQRVAAWPDTRRNHRPIRVAVAAHQRLDRHGGIVRQSVA